jgi:hypothetical protein
VRFAGVLEQRAQHCRGPRIEAGELDARRHFVDTRNTLSCSQRLPDAIDGDARPRAWLE